MNQLTIVIVFAVWLDLTLLKLKCHDIESLCSYLMNGLMLDFEACGCRVILSIESVTSNARRDIALMQRFIANDCSWKLVF